MRCSISALFACLSLGVAGTQEWTSIAGLRRPRGITEDGICSASLQHTCRNGDCVAVVNATCDGVIQCRDGSDEVDCPGRSNVSGCTLPPHPTGGSFLLPDCTGDLCEVLPEGRVPSGTFLNYDCNEGYIIKGNHISYCYVNAWYLPPTCVITCPALESETVNFACRYQGEIVPCGHKVFPGTEATLTCKHSYKIPRSNGPWYGKITCLEDGTWDRPVFTCDPECGTAAPRGTPLIANGTVTKYGDFPWHVGIHEKISGGKFRQSCGGTLVSPNLVISAAHCFFDDGKNALKNASEFIVTAGKYYRTINVPELYAQSSTVRKIEKPERYIALPGNYAYDIALVYLVSPFMMTALVRPICIDWDNWVDKEQLQNGKRGKVMGWGTAADGAPSFELQAIELPFVDFPTCIRDVPEDFRPLITNDKFCAGYLNGSSVCSGDSGGGLCFEYYGFWYLRGIVSISPRFGDTTCNNYYTAFTNISIFKEWIHAATFRTSDPIPGEDNSTIVDHAANSTSIGCILPKKPKGGTFVLRSCREQCDVPQGIKLPIGSSLVYRCNKPYTLKGDDTSVCHDGVWSQPPTCVRACPALKSKGVDFECRHNGEMVSCKSNILTGTKASLACTKWHKIRPDLKKVTRQRTCLARGQWTPMNFGCIPECGQALTPDNQSSDDHSAKPGEFPWNVGIYVMNSTGKYEQICAGTLISLIRVISAAHCFWNETSMAVRNPEEFYVGTGNYVELYNKRLTHTYPQRSQVKKIDVAERYFGRIGKYANDIALLHLKNRFASNKAVSPICMDWDSAVQTEQLQIGYSGKMAVWGKTTEGVSTNIRAITLPFVPHETCVAALPGDLKGFVTPEKFCAGYSNGSSFGYETSGSGLAFQYSGLWFLRGVLSVGPLGIENNHYTVFTNIGHFAYLRTKYA